MTTTSTTPAYVIRDARRAGFVTRYAPDVRRVQLTSDRKRAHKFASQAEANAFLAAHSNPAEGLVARCAFVELAH